MPLISIIIPTYNREKTIGYCLDSVLSQTYQNIEVIVVDDASSDKTIEIVNAYADPRVRCIALKVNSGAQAARNEGIKYSRGDWIAFQDSDDEWLPHKLSIQLNEALMTNADVVYCECYVNGSDNLRLFGSKGYVGNIYKHLLIEPDPTFPGLLVKKTCFESCGMLDVNVPAYQEWDTCIALSKQYKFAYCDEPLYIYHLHEGETISKDTKRGYDGIAYILKKYANEMELYAGTSVMVHYYSYLVNGYRELGYDCEELKHQLLEYKEQEERTLKESQRICVFGASLTGAKCIQLLEQSGKEIICFVDNNPELKVFNGFHVHSVENIKRAKPDLIVLASSGNYLSMKRQLLELNITNNTMNYMVLRETITRDN